MKRIKLILILCLLMVGCAPKMVEIKHLTKVMSHTFATEFDDLWAYHAAGCSIDVCDHRWDYCVRCSERQEALAEGILNNRLGVPNETNQ